MAALWELLWPIIAEFGIASVLQALVDNGLLPASVLGQQDTALEHEPYIIEQMAEAASLNVADPRWGNHALLDKLQQVQNDIAASRVSILDAISGISNTEQPPWYTPPTASGDVAHDVWFYDGDTHEDDLAWNHLLLLERYAALTSEYGSWPWWADPMFAISGSFKYPPD